MRSGELLDAAATARSVRRCRSGPCGGSPCGHRWRRTACGCSLAGTVTPGITVPRAGRVLYLDGAPIAPKHGREIHMSEALDGTTVWDARKGAGLDRSGRACPPASPAGPRSRPYPPPPSSKRRRPASPGPRPRRRAPAARLFGLHAKLKALRTSPGASRAGSPPGARAPEPRPRSSGALLPEYRAPRAGKRWAGVPPVPWTVYGLGFKPCIAVVSGSVLDISSSRS